MSSVAISDINAPTRPEPPKVPPGPYFEICGPAGDGLYTLFGYLPGTGMKVIDEYSSLEEAREACQWISGVPIDEKRGDLFQVFAHSFLSGFGWTLGALTAIVLWLYWIGVW